MCVCVLLVARVLLRAQVASETVFVLTFYRMQITLEFSNMSHQYDFKDECFPHVVSALIYSLQSRKILYFRNKAFISSFT